VGYLEEQACIEYTHFLKAIDSGKIKNEEAPEIAKKYWNLAPDAKLRDVVLAVRADEAFHR
jgi:ubiquinol oxidase